MLESHGMDPNAPPAPPGLEPEELETVIAVVSEAIRTGDLATVGRILAELRLPERADVFEGLEPETRSLLIESLPDEQAADILEELEDEDAADIALTLHPRELAPILDLMEPDEAADVLGDLPREQAESTLRAMDDEAEAVARSLMVWSDETAGGRMTGDYFALATTETVGEAIERLRDLAPDDNVAYYLYVIEPDGELAGVASLRQLITSRPAAVVADLMDADVIRAHVKDDQEAAARLMARYDLMALPVVDDLGRLVGVITHDDLVDVLEEEITEDMYGLVGLDIEERPQDSPRLAVRRRLPWLTLNLFLALVGISVLKRFESLIEVVPVLAVLFPLVTGQGGNVGTQTMTLVVRWMAVGELPPGRVRRLLAREAAVAAANGVAIGLLAGVVALVLSGEAGLAGDVALAMAIAMLANFVAGGIVGVAVPTGLRAVGVDPAVASVLFVTTTTDALGILFFMGSYRLLLGGG